MSQKPQTYHDFSNGECVLTPARPTAQSLYDAFARLREAEDEQKAARGRVPDYTGQWSDIDYYGAQQEALNRAVDAFEDALVESVRSSAAETP